MFSKKRKRRIVVNGNEYYWCAKNEEGFVELFILTETPGGPSYSCHFQTNQFVVTPYIVRKTIENALKNGWQPFEKGKDIFDGNIDTQIDLRLDQNTVYAIREKHGYHHKFVYFVRHLLPGEHPRPHYSFLIRSINKQGVLDTAHFSSDSNTVVLHGNTVPSSVIDAAKHYPSGFEGYLSEDGASVDVVGNLIKQQDFSDAESLSRHLLLEAKHIIAQRLPGTKARMRLNEIMNHYKGTEAYNETLLLIRACAPHQYFD